MEKTNRRTWPVVLAPQALKSWLLQRLCSITSRSTCRARVFSSLNWLSTDQDDWPNNLMVEWRTKHVAKLHFLLFEPSIPLNTTCDGFAPFQLLIMFEYGCEFVRRCGCGKGLECNDCSWDNSTMQGGSAEGDAPGMLGTQSNIYPAWCCDRTVLHMSTPERSNFQQLLQLSVPCMYSLSR